MRRASSARWLWQWGMAAAVLLLASPACLAGDAPQWMHALVGRPLPAYDDKTDAVLLYGETNVNVVSAEKIKRSVRRAYKILRPGGREYGSVVLPFNSNEKIGNLHAWCIPAQGKDYEVKEKDSVEAALPKVEGSELINDVKAKILRIPAADPGNIVGYEYDIEERPMLLQDDWRTQDEIPVQESHYTLQLPAGWEYKAVWLNAPELKPDAAGERQWHWKAAAQKAIRREDDMPPLKSVAGQMIVTFLSPSGLGANNFFMDWRQMGTWYRNLTAGRTEASPEIRQKVKELTDAKGTPLEKMKALAQFVQHDIRYVAIELGIGGWQPHPAAEVFTHRYGDCKDKATLLASMLREIGTESYYVVINSERGAISPGMPAHNGFNHVVLAMKLPPQADATSAAALIQHARLGKLLVFDPTNELTPFGQISGHLQANYGLLAAPEGGELIELPKQPASLNGVHRKGKLGLDAAGTLKGDIEEVRVGDRAWSQRWAQRTVMTDTARIKPIEKVLANSLSRFQITKAVMVNMDKTDLPFGFNYTFTAENYAKRAGGLLLLRPRVLGTKSSALLETKEPRQFPVEFEAPVRDTDSFEIELPAGFEVDELPPPADADFSFGSYHSRAEAKGNSIVYKRTFEIKELSVPVSKCEELKKFYRIIFADERNTAVLKPK